MCEAGRGEGGDTRGVHCQLDCGHHWKEPKLVGRLDLPISRFEVKREDLQEDLGPEDAHGHC